MVICWSEHRFLSLKIRVIYARYLNAQIINSYGELFSLHRFWLVMIFNKYRWDFNDGLKSLIFTSRKTATTLYSGKEHALLWDVEN